MIARLARQWPAKTLLLLMLLLGSSIGADHDGTDEASSGTVEEECAAAANDEEEWCDDCDWEDLAETLNCEEVHGRSVPTLEEYMVMRWAYEEVVGKDESTISPVVETDCFMVPHRADQAGNKGRGIFATEFIPKGTPMITFRQTATFYDGPSVRKFLSKIPHMSACDFMYWAYSMWEDDEETVASISVDLDDSAMCNNSRNTKDTNLGCDPEAAKNHDGGCDKYAFAMKDIQPEEEILCHYSDFSAGNKGWTSLGLGWSEEEE